MKIKVKLFPGGKMPEVNEKGDLFDVFSRELVELKAPQAGVQKKVKNEKVRDVTFSSALIPLGFAMELPEGFKAQLYPRSSTWLKWHFIFGNSIGNIDSTYAGEEDEWKVSAIALGNMRVKAGDKIAQFDIVPSSKATFWQKLKWLFSSKIEFVQVTKLSSTNRGGFGSTGSR